jgi:pheromone a factor receptor
MDTSYINSTGPFPLPAMSVILPILSIAAILLEIPPFFCNLRNRNYGAVSLILWLGLIQFFYFVNPMIWSRDNVDSWWDGSGLCDLEVRIQIGSEVAIPGSILCIVRRLARIMDTSKAVVVPSPARRRLDALLDIFLCIGFPVLLMALYYIVQPIRYFIYTTTGCDAALQRSWPSILIISIWPLILSMINAALSSKFFHQQSKYRN